MDTKALRQKILDLAIRGKLVPQDPNDEPASVLLERIRAEKQQMVKDGKLKAKDIKNDSIIFVGEDSLHYEKFADGSVKCIEDEIHFTLPEGWEWTQLGAIFIHNTGKALNSSNNVGKPYTYITTSNLYWDHFELDNLKTMYFTDEELNKCTVSKGDLLVCEGGDIGRSAIWNYDMPIRIQNHIHKLRCVVPIAVSFYYYVLYLYKQTDKINGNGIGMQGLSSNRLHSILVPFPPLAEQQRIVDSIEKYNDIISALETDIESVKDTIATTKSKILDLAIQGKLVPQDPNDEPASVLLERIRAEKEELIKQGKIKRDKKESVIFKGEDNSYYEKVGIKSSPKCIDNEIPFAIPPSWEWVRLGEIFAHNTGKALNSSDTAGSLLPYITTSNLYWDHFILDSLKKMYFSESEIEKCTVKKGDLLVCEGGDIGRAAIWEYDEEMRIQNHIHKLRPFIMLSNRFYYYVFYLWKQQERIGGQGIGLQGFSSKAIHNLIIPLPPLREQRKIVFEIDRIFSIINGIEQSLS